MTRRQYIKKHSIWLGGMLVYVLAILLLGWWPGGMKALPPLPAEGWHVEGARGQIGVVHWEASRPVAEAPAEVGEVNVDGTRLKWHEKSVMPFVLGYRGYAQVGAAFRDGRGWRFNLWLPLWVMVILYGRSAWVMARKRKLAFAVERGLCLKCGYDLRATSERCPECGEATRTGHRPSQGNRRVEQ